MGLTLSAVYPDYFGQAPRSLSRGSNNVKAIFKGQYQVYPPIRTLTFSDFSVSNLKTYVIVQVFKEGNTWYYVITNNDYVPGFRIWLHGTHTVSSTYGSVSYSETAYIDISAGSKTLGYKYSFTPVHSSGNGLTYLQYNLTYGIGTLSGGGSVSSSYQDLSYNGVSYRVCSYGSTSNGYLSGDTVYKYYLGGTSYPKIYCAPQAFTITYQTGTSSWNSINVPLTNNGTTSFGYVSGTYFYLYDYRMPRVPNKVGGSGNLGSRIKIYNANTTLTTGNAWHYLSAYFTNRSTSTLTNYYQNLTGDSSNINLFDYGVTATKTTTYRYDIPAGSSNRIYEIKKGSSYEWDIENAEATFYLTPFGQNVANGFYILDFYLTEPGASFYFHAWMQQGGNYQGEINYNCNNLSAGTQYAVAGTTTWGLNQADKFDIFPGGTLFASYGNNIELTSGNPSYSYNLHNLGTSQLTIKLKGLYQWTYIYKSNTRIKAGWGIDWFDTWAWAKRENTYSVSVNDYFANPPTSSSDYKSLTVYCLCWSGYYRTASNQVSMRKMGTFTVYAKTSTSTSTIVM